MVWIPKANVRGPRGLDATGAAEDDAAVAAFIRGGADGTTQSLAAVREIVASLAGGGALGAGRPAALTPFDMRLADRNLAPVNVLTIGDSLVQGTAADPYERRWSDLIGGMLASSYNPQGIGGGAYSALYHFQSWTFTGTRTIVDRGLSQKTYLFAAGATASRTFAILTGLTVYYAQGPGAGAFTIQIDGATPITVTPDLTGVANRHDGEFKLTGIERGSHVVKITATGAAEISGVYAHDRDETLGMRVVNSGLGGAEVATFTFAATELLRRVGTLQPALIFICLGVNDWRNGVTPATYQSRLGSLIALLKGAITKPCTFVLVGEPEKITNPGTASTWQAMLDAAKATAAANPAERLFIDTSKAFPKTMAADAYGLMDPDGVHPTTRGHAVMADIIAEGLHMPVRSSAKVFIAGGGSVVAPAPVETVIASDGFTGADTTTIQGRTTDSTMGGTAVTWATASGGTATPPTSDAAKIVGGKLVRGTSTAGVFGLPVTQTNIEVAALVTALPTGTNPVFIFGRRPGVSYDTGNQYRIRITGTTAQLEKTIAGANTLLGAASPIAVGDKIALRMVGSSIVLKVNDVAVQTVTDTAITAGGVAGFTTAASAEAFGFEYITITNVPA